MIPFFRVVLVRNDGQLEPQNWLSCAAVSIQRIQSLAAINDRYVELNKSRYKEWYIEYKGV